MISKEAAAEKHSDMDQKDSYVGEEAQIGVKNAKNAMHTEDSFSCTVTERRKLPVRVCVTIQVGRPHDAMDRPRVCVGEHALDFTTTPQHSTATRTELAL